VSLPSIPSRPTRGFSVYTLSETATDAEAAALAAKENKSDIIAGVDLAQYPTEVANILIDFAQAKTNEMSVAFARDYVLEEIAPVTLLSRYARRSRWQSLTPSILVDRLSQLSGRGKGCCGRTTGASLPPRARLVFY
jgi:N-acetylmuramoyl-L-alanine amidase